MIKFEGNIVQFGFGAVGKSFYEKIRKEIKFNEYKYYIITANPNEFDAFIKMGGLVSNFYVNEVTKDNFQEIFSKYLNEGDLLIDFADTVGTKDICAWAAQNNIMYINTGEADWPEHWYSIFEENLKKRDLKNNYNNNDGYNKHPIILQHGNNPGLVSHFVKLAIEYIVKKQFPLNLKLHKLMRENKYNEIAKFLGIRMIHVNDIDTQVITEPYVNNKLYSTWCIDSFFYEMLSEATANIGTHEKIDYEENCNLVDKYHGFLEFKGLATNTKCCTYYPNGKFTGFLVPHEETITIATNLEVKNNNEIIYRPSVMFLYSPCSLAQQYFNESKVNDYNNPDVNKLLDGISQEGDTIVRGYKYPQKYEIAYKEKIKEGTEYVGVLLLGEKFNPVWVGNRIEPKFLYKGKDSYWQTPTITPVAMSALAAVCWMIKNKDKKGIYFPDDINDFHYIVKLAEKYISKTIYKTFDKKEIEDALNVNYDNLQLKDFFVK